MTIKTKDEEKILLCLYIAQTDLKTMKIKDINDIEYPHNEINDIAKRIGDTEVDMILDKLYNYGLITFDKVIKYPFLTNNGIKYAKYLSKNVFLRFWIDLTNCEINWQKIGVILTLIIIILSIKGIM